MKNIATVVLFFVLCSVTVHAQWSLTGNSGTTPGTNFIGTTDAKDLVFKTNSIERGRILNASGTWRFGGSSNFVKIDSTGSMTFAGTAVYRVGNNKYAFQAQANPNYGLFFNATSLQYEFRNASAAPMLSIGAATGNGIFTGTLKIGAYTLPATDGSSGQLLKTNGAGVLTWQGDDNTVYTPGTGISIAGNTISNTGDVNASDDANLSLSNLSSTSVNQSLIPNTSATFDLGSASVSWRNIYTGGKLFLGGVPFLGGFGTANIFAGSNAGLNNVSGTDNSALGNYALYNNNSGSRNSAVGSSALYNNSTGYSNVAIGYQALRSNISGYGNIAIGDSALLNSTASYPTTAIGVQALFANTTGYSNTATGSYALKSNTTGYGNTGMGYATLYANTVGYGNTAVGNGALNSNTIGWYNTATGYFALLYNTTGPGNTAYGSSALVYNTTGGDNDAYGVSALYTNTTGNFNCAFGNYSMYLNTTGTDNNAHGFYALHSNTTGSYNCAFGNYSMDYNSTGQYNTAVGTSSLLINSSGSSNTAIGHNTLVSNTSGHSNVAVGVNSLYANTTMSNLVAIGDSALFNNGTGASSGIDGTANVAAGSKALFGNTTGRANSAFGFQASYATTTGIHNTSCGYNALHTNTTGSDNTAVGYGADVTLTGLSNATAIGSGASVTASNNVVSGNSSVVGWGFGVTPGVRAIKVGSGATNGNGAFLTVGGVWTDVSDRNKKSDFKKLDANEILSKVNQLDIPEWKYTNTKNEYHIGPMADQFHQLFEVGDDTSLSAMDKSGVALLAIQALSVANDSLKDQNKNLESIVSDQQSAIGSLQNQLSEMETQMQQFNQSLNDCCAKNQSSTIDGTAKITISNEAAGALLGQNIPNPFDNSTLIPFRIPKGCSDASIVIAESATGRIVRVIPVSCSETQLTLEAGTLASGAYSYTLYVDGKQIDTKQMVLVK